MIILLSLQQRVVCFLFFLPVKMANKLNAKQRKAFELITQHQQNVFITGSGGCGKSFLIKEVVRDMQARNVPVAVTASTGAAAVLIDGMTVHRWSGCGIFDRSAEALAREILQNPRKRAAKQNWLTTAVLIIDEISMIDAETFDKLEEVARRVRQQLQRPFGGMQLIVCGDFGQLPPVKAVGGFAFQGKSWNTVLLPANQIELTDVIRQTDAAFVKGLCEARMGLITATTAAMLRSRVGAQVGTDLIKPTTIFPRRDDVSGKNAAELAKIQAPEVVFRAQDHFYPFVPTQKQQYIDDANKNMQAPEVLVLKQGAQVMLIANLSDALVNGSRGVVMGFRDALPIVQFMSGEVLLLERRKSRMKLTEQLCLERAQIPLILSWALTAHKCVAGHTMIFTTEGIRSIDSIWSSFAPNDNGWKPLSLSLYTHDSIGKTSQIFKASTEEKTIVMTTSLGYQLEGSHIHPVLVKRKVNPDEDHRFVWVKMPDLCVGDVVVLRRGVVCAATELKDQEEEEISTSAPYSVVPWYVLQGTVECQKSFLVRLFDGKTRFTCNSRKFCNQVQLLLLAHGVISSISMTETETETAVSLRRLWNLDMLGNLESGGRGYFFDEIKDLRESSSLVYDFEVPGAHSFIANGFVSHNCQGATLDCAEIDIAGCFDFGQAYVALSRVRNLEGLSIKGTDLSRITAHPAVKTYYESLSSIRDHSADQQDSKALAKREMIHRDKEVTVKKQRSGTADGKISETRDHSADQQDSKALAKREMIHRDKEVTVKKQRSGTADGKISETDPK
jgi:hypothetical protein